MLVGRQSDAASAHQRKERELFFPPEREGEAWALWFWAGLVGKSKTGLPSFWLSSSQWKMMTACYSLVAVSPRSVGTCCSTATRNRIWRSWWIFWRGKTVWPFFSLCMFQFFANWRLVFRGQSSKPFLSVSSDLFVKRLCFMYMCKTTREICWVESPVSVPDIISLFWFNTNHRWPELKSMHLLGTVADHAKSSSMDAISFQFGFSMGWTLYPFHLPFANS